MRDEGLTTNAIAKQIGVSRPTISRLFSGKTWGQK
ncbi:TetR family transcriptional regulator [Mesotoga prima]